ncbi:hypothetical protein P154DRAFT_263338 [Amniculicola lignicola CBS 123094]|uniref:Uncharacterized protein n=1 Tax=Amniculicola lignicola CBS 123094 TaxID=1392246 RepID=A0A6A5WKF5_9PLEO|nr:hypothetical protein P154DRAFT_263338 [Amniculicola lignicola CBS 123094]
MLPTAGLFLPETLHRNLPSTSEEDTRRAKRRTITRKSFDRPSTARSSTEDVSNVFASLSTVFNFTDFVASLNEVSAEVKVFVNLIQRVWQDVTEASRLATCDAVTEYYAPFPVRKAWIDDTVLDVRRALNEIGAYVENVRVSGHEGGTVRMKHRFEWVLSHHQKLISRELALLTCHQSLTAAIMTMQAVEMGRDSSPRVFEAPAQPWLKTTNQEIMRSPHSRQKWRINQRNLSSPSITVSECEDDKVETQSINTLPSELPGSNPLDLAQPENWDLYEPPLKPPTSPPKPARAPPRAPVSSPKPPTTHSNTFPLATVKEKPVISLDEPDAFSKQRSIKLARRYQARAVEVRKSLQKHQSLPSFPSELPYLPHHSSLISELSNWVLPNADFESYARDKGNHVSSQSAKASPAVDSASRSSTSSPDTLNSTVSCPEPLRIRRPVSSLYSTTSIAHATQNQASTESLAKATITASNDAITGSTSNAIDKISSEKATPRMPRYYANTEAKPDEDENISETAPLSASNKVPETTNRGPSQPNGPEGPATGITSTTSPTSDSSASPDSAKSPSSHASQSSLSSISSHGSTTSSKTKYSLFPTPTVVVSVPRDTQPPTTAIAVTAATQPNISPDTALSSHPPPSHGDIIVNSSDSLGETATATPAPPIAEPVLSPPTSSEPEAAESISPTDHNHYVSVCYSPKEKRKSCPPPAAVIASSLPPHPAPARPLPSLPSEDQKSIVQYNPTPVIILHSPKFPAVKQPWLPYDSLTQPEVKGFPSSKVPKGNAGGESLSPSSEPTIPDAKFSVPETTEKVELPIKKKPVTISLPSWENYKNGQPSTLVDANTPPRSVSLNYSVPAVTSTQPPNDAPDLPKVTGVGILSSAQKPQPLMVSAGGAVKKEAQEIPKPSSHSEVDSPKPLTAQAKRRRAQARRLQMAYGSD